MATLFNKTESLESDLKILIIDDDEVDQMAIKRSLHKSNLKTTLITAKTAHEGLQLLQQEQFDCIFIDFMLPDMDGLKLMELLSDLQVTAPVLIVTSHGDEQIAAKAIRLGAADYIPKSLLTPEGISHGIRNAIRLQQAKQERQKAEEQLRFTQNQLELVISNSPMAFWNVSGDGTVHLAKGMVFERIGLNPTDIIGKSVFEVFARYPRVLNDFRQSMHGEVVQSVDRLQDFYIKSHYMPVYDSYGNVQGITGFAIDITDSVNNERELTKAKELAENSVHVKEQFLANISHEIRTPMNGIIGLAQVLQKTDLEPTQQKYLGAIQKSADNLMHIINDLLDFSKMTAHQFAFEEVEFNLTDEIADIVDLMDSKARERSNSISSFINSEVPSLLIGDPLRLRQVFLNLLGNAIKFTQNGAIELLVQVLHEKETDIRLEFTVQDTGIGIPPEKLSAVFESFNQGSNDTTRKYGGTGLGLTISKNLVEMQGGTISVRSQQMVGSAFTFSLPFKKIQENKEVETTGNTQSGNKAGIDLSGLKVLLAEDNEINQLLIKTVLSNWEIEVDIVNNGLEALEKYNTASYDLILMDMQMPEVDGYEAIELIRASGNEKAKMPIIALTAHASTEEVAKCLAAGANAYVSKPFEQEDLKQAIYNLT